MNPERLYIDDLAEIWHGDSLDPATVGCIMGDRLANAVIVDAPYSPKTHSGHQNGRLTADRAAAFAAANSDAPTPESRYSARKSKSGESGRRDIIYGAWTNDNIISFCDRWLPRSMGWLVCITDDVLAPLWAQHAEEHGLYPFTPLPLVETGSRVRMTGDGPSNWTCWIVVARPRSREFASWGTLPGSYVQPAERDINSKAGSERIVGGKPLGAMMAIVRDYSRPGDLIVDPCCGAGTTGLAAKMQGRRFIGVDANREHAELSAKRLAKSRHQLAMPWAENV